MATLASLNTKKESPEIKFLRKAFNTAKLKDIDGSLLGCCAGNRGNSMNNLGNTEFIDDGKLSQSLYNIIKDKDMETKTTTHVILEEWFNEFVTVVENGKKNKTHTGNVIVGLASIELSQICLLRQTIYNRVNSEKNANYFYSAWGVEFALHGINKFIQVIESLKQEATNNEDMFKTKLEDQLKSKRDEYEFSKDDKTKKVDNLYFNGAKKENEPPIEVWLHRKAIISVYNLIRCCIMSNVLNFQTLNPKQWGTIKGNDNNKKAPPSTTTENGVDDTNEKTNDNANVPLTFFKDMYDVFKKDKKLTHNNKNPTKQIFEKSSDFKATMDDLNVVLGSNGSKMFQKKGKDFEDGFSIIDVAPNKKEINWLESPPKGSSGACSIQ